MGCFKERVVEGTAMGFDQSGNTSSGTGSDTSDSGVVLHEVPAFRVPSLKVGEKIEVRICDNPISYEHFYIRPILTDRVLEVINKPLNLLPSMGLCRQSAANLSSHSNDAQGLCLVIHPQTKKYMRGRIESEIDPQGKVTMFYLDTGERGIFTLRETWQLPEQAANFDPLAVRCSLPVTAIVGENCPPEELSKVMERFFRLNRKTILAHVFAISGGSHIIDLTIKTEGVTFCEALLRINEAKFASSIPAELQTQIANEFQEKANLNRLAVWNWRQLFRAMYTSNMEIINAELKSGKSLLTMASYFKECLITSTLEQCVIDVLIQYSCVSKCGGWIVLYCVTDHPVLNCEHRTLQSQIQMFFQRVRAPRMSEQEVRECTSLMSVRLDENHPKRINRVNHPKYCTWHRSFYASEPKSIPNINCIDCLWNTNDLNDLEFCLLPVEFYGSCPLSLVVEIKLTEDSTTGLKPRDFPNGARKTISILNAVPRMQNGFPYYTGVVLDEI